MKQKPPKSFYDFAQGYTGSAMFTGNHHLEWWRMSLIQTNIKGEKMSTYTNSYQVNLLTKLIDKFILEYGPNKNTESFLDFLINNGINISKFHIYETVKIPSDTDPNTTQDAIVSGIVTGAFKSKILYFISKKSSQTNETSAFYESQLYKFNEPYIPLNYREIYSETGNPSKAKADADASEDNKTKLRRIFDGIENDFEEFLSVPTEAAKHLIDKGVLVSKYKPQESIYIIDNYDVINDCSACGAPYEKIERKIRKCTILSVVFDSLLGRPSYSVMPEKITERETNGMLTFDWEGYLPEWSLCETEEEAQKAL